jgi:hypothetical protein
LKIAEQNQSYAKDYEDVKQLLREGDTATAIQSLQLIWKNAPYYGDPAKLAIQVGMQAPDREVIQREQDRLNFVSRSLPRGLETSPDTIWWSTLGLLVGLGSFIGILTQSWLWAGSMSLLLVLPLFLLRHYRAKDITKTVCVFLISIALVCGIAWYASTLNYNEPHISHLWLIGNRTLWLNRQIYFGLASGIPIGSFLLLIYTFNMEVDFRHYFLFLPLILLWLISTFFGWGFGYGFGWPFALCGCLIGCIGAPGLIYSIVTWSTYGRYLASRKKWTWYR